MLLDLCSRNLSDLTNDNALDVYEFSLAMHLIHGNLLGMKIPPVLPEYFVQKQLKSITLQPLSDMDKEIYRHVFTQLASKGSMYLEGKYQI